jgi:hypothetical protein
MAVSVIVVDQWNDQGRVNTLMSLAFSGNYTAGGETLDFAQYQQGSVQPSFVQIQGRAGFGYTYDSSTKKLQVRGSDPAAAGGAIAGLPEIAAAAYPAGVTGDAVRALTVSRIN